MASGLIAERRGICRLLRANTGALPIGQLLAALPPTLPFQEPEVRPYESCPSAAHSGAPPPPPVVPISIFTPSHTCQTPQLTFCPSPMKIPPSLTPLGITAPLRVYPRSLSSRSDCAQSPSGIKF